MLRRVALTLCLAAGPLPPMPAAAEDCDASFVVENEGDAAIVRLHLRHAPSGPWGRDLLGPNTIVSGDAAAFQPSPGGRYDLRTVSADGRTLEALRVDLCSVTAVVVSDQGIIAR